MTTYDAQLYTFLTKPENFEPFIDLSEQYDKVKRRLINEFWVLVLEEARKLKPEKLPWELGIESIDTPWRKLFARHSEISDHKLNAAVLYERLEEEVVLGAWFDRGNPRFNDAMTEIWKDGQSYLDTTPALKGDYAWAIGGGKWWFAIYKYPGLNLSKKTSLLQILPEVREPLAKYYASLLISAVEQLGSYVYKNAVIQK